MLKKPEEQATKLFAEVKLEHPDLWFEVISQLHLLAIQEHFGYTPAGLDPEMRKRLDALTIAAISRRDP